MTDLLGKPTVVQSPSVVIFNLNNSQLIRRFSIPKSQTKPSSFFVNIVSIFDTNLNSISVMTLQFVDVAPGRCETETFAYILDIYAYGIIVYDFKHDRSWRVNHNYFAFDPVQGNLNVAGVNFQWHDGVFGMALGEVDGERG